MIHAVLARRRNQQAEPQGFTVARMAVAVISRANRNYSNADPTMLALTVARKAVSQPATGLMTLAGMTVARRTISANSTPAPTLVGMTVARKANEPKTPTLVSRMAIAVVHK